jgi:hypothetical protein
MGLPSPGDLQLSRTSSERATASLGARIVVGVFLTLLVGLFDVFLAKGVVVAWGTRGWVAAEGRILASAVTRSYRHRGRSQKGVAVSYEYWSQGYRRQGTRYAPNDPGTSSGSWAEDVVAALPPGKAVTVYVDPGDPRQATLKRGVQGGDLLWPLLLVPFNLMVLGVWSGVALVLRARREGRPYVESKTLSPRVAALVTTGVAALVAMIFVAMVFGLEPELSIAAGAWLATLLAGVGVGLRVQRRSAAGPPSAAVSVESSRR